MKSTERGKMKTSLALLLLISLASCNKTKVASSTKGSINAEAPYIWPSISTPRTLLISSTDSFGFNTREVAQIKAMGDVWESALNNTNFFDYGTTSEKTRTIASASELADYTFGVYKAQVWPYPQYPDALAVTQIFGYRYNTGTANEYVRMEEADIVMNYDNFGFEPGVYAHYDFETVILHELGHFLGLGHRKTANRADSVMYPSIHHWEDKREPQSIDIGDLASKYSINLGGGSGLPAMTGNLPVYQPNGPGEPVRIILELKADGECVHHDDGAVVLRHHVKLK